MFPQVPQSFLGILTVPQIPHPIEHPPLKNPTRPYEKDPLGRSNWWKILEIHGFDQRKHGDSRPEKLPPPLCLKQVYFITCVHFIKLLNIKIPKDPITAKSIRRSTKDHARVNHRSPDYFFWLCCVVFFVKIGVILLISPLKNVGPFQKPKSPEGTFTFLGLVTT